MSTQAERNAALYDSALTITSDLSLDSVLQTRDVVDRFLITLPPADQRRIVLSLSEDELPGRWDELRLEQVLVNLLANAVKFSPGEGEISVVVSRSGERAIVSIRDHGIGVPAEQAHRVFDAFFRADSTAARHIRGSGLGLHIARSIVEMHGGKIWFESVEGAGSTFHFTLPLATTARSEQPSPA